jgi:hypothetical protein
LDGSFLLGFTRIEVTRNDDEADVDVGTEVVGGMWVVEVEVVELDVVDASLEELVEEVDVVDVELGVVDEV